MKRLAVAILASLVPYSSFGAAIGLTGVTGGFSDGVQRVIGWQFTVGDTAIAVDELGVLDFELDGLADSHQVGVWLLDQTVVVSATVPAGTSATAQGNFRYVDVENTVLQANTEYVIGATWEAGGDQFAWDQDITAAPGFAVDSFVVDPRIELAADGFGRFNDFNSAFAFPTKTIGTEFPGDPRRAFWGPNFTIVPEPSTVFLALACIHGLIRRR